ncbi:MAG: hypothetical protein ACP5QK_10345, partial [Myxococcota bacterium]
EKMLPVLFKMFVFDAPEKGFILNPELFGKRYYPAFERVLKDWENSRISNEEKLKRCEEMRTYMIETALAITGGGKITEEQKKYIEKNELQGLLMLYCKVENNTMDFLNTYGLSKGITSGTIPVRVSA